MESTDQQILALLARDGRMSYTDIGRVTGLSTSAAQQRVRRLEARGLIDGYSARLNAEALGRNLTAFIALRPLDPADVGVGHSSVPGQEGQDLLIRTFHAFIVSPFVDDPRFAHGFRHRLVVLQGVLRSAR